MKSKIKPILLVSFLGIFLYATYAHAQFVTCGGPGQPACQIKDIIYLINRIINFLLSWAWLISLFMILWAAFTMGGANGNEETISVGKETLTKAIIGFFLIMISYVLINWIVSALIGRSVEAGSFDMIINSFILGR